MPTEVRGGKFITARMDLMIAMIDACSTIIKKQSMNFVSLSMNNGLSIEEFQSSYPQNRPTLPRISRATIDPIGKECQTTPDEAPLPDE